MRSMITVWLSTLLALAPLAAGCATEPGDGDASTGESTIELPLRQVASDGAVYRLTASFLVSSGGAETLVDGNADGPSVIVPVAAGPTVVTLLPGWTLERSVDLVNFVPVTAVLGSINPLRLDVAPGATVQIRYDFVIRTASTLVQIFFGVDPSTNEITGAMSVHDANGVYTGYLGHRMLYRIYQDATLFTAFVDPNGTSRCVYFGTRTALEVFNDTIGVVASLAPRMSGGGVRYEVSAEPFSGVQSLSITFNTTPVPGDPFSQTLQFGPNVIATQPLDGNGCPVNPATSGLSTTMGLTQTTVFDSNGGASGLFATATVQFLPSP